MPRIKIETPDNIIFTTEIALRISDINYGGHLGHDTILSLTHEARVRFLTQNNYTELDIEGVGLIMSDVGITYKSECFYGDIIKTDIGLGSLGKTNFELIYILSNTKNGNEVAKVMTRLVFFDYNARKTVQMPEKFKDILIS